MDPNLSKTEAHLLFGKLYRKKRSPELQNKIDAIVASTSDIYIRIQKIENFDAQNAPKVTKTTNQKKQKTPNKSVQTITKSTPSPIKKSVSRTPTTKGISQPRPSQKANISQDRKSIGFFERFFSKKENKNIYSWGEATKVLHKGFFNVELSQASKNIFSGLRQEDVIKTLKAFRVAIGGIWKQVEPSTYNSLVIAYQFFSEYTKYGNLFARTEESVQWINQTITMQKYYAQMLKYPNYANILEDIFPNYITTLENHASTAPIVRKCMKHITTLEQKEPNLQNVIIGFYVLDKKDLYTWQDIEKKIAVSEPVLNNYKAPKEVKGLINQHIQHLWQRHGTLSSEIAEIRGIREKYLSLDDQGKFKGDFLNGIIFDVLRRAYGDKALPSHIIQSYKSQPHRLLFSVLRDFNINYIPIIGSNILISRENKASDTLTIFVPGLFSKHVENYNETLRSIDSFQKKYPGLVYSFKDFSTDLKNQVHDPGIGSLHRIIKQANSFFQKLVFDMQTILNNHNHAKQQTQEKSLSPEQIKQKEVPITTLDLKARFLPYATANLISSSRLNGKTVEFLIQDMVFHLYNYLYIFRDQTTSELLASSPKLNADKLEIEKELQKMQGNIQSNSQDSQDSIPITE